MDTRASALAAAAGAALGGLAVYVLSRRRDDGPPPAPAPRQTFRHFPVRGPLQRSYERFKQAFFSIYFVKVWAARQPRRDDARVGARVRARA